MIGVKEILAKNWIEFIHAIGVIAIATAYNPRPFAAWIDSAQFYVEKDF